ncbi:hypothetical protein GWI33_007199 [Rhynchophorus ferrugineus]|uniref:Uncharacterized protein n=1 Tax=Rhynchophorus ferrugineus TaxID=354439 RepID=A0A834IHY6_RHYFE|nr:hypothetical protein GWI33_007199 [Rhynchophorus ferrugineus]
MQHDETPHLRRYVFAIWPIFTDSCEPYKIRSARRRIISDQSVKIRSTFSILNSASRYVSISRANNARNTERIVSPLLFASIHHFTSNIKSPRLCPGPNKSSGKIFISTTCLINDQTSGTRVISEMINMAHVYYLQESQLPIKINGFRLFSTNWKEAPECRFICMGIHLETIVTKSKIVTSEEKKQHGWMTACKCYVQRDRWDVLIPAKCCFTV